MDGIAGHLEVSGGQRTAQQIRKPLRIFTKTGTAIRPGFSVILRLRIPAAPQWWWAFQTPAGGVEGSVVGVSDSAGVVEGLDAGVSAGVLPGWTAGPRRITLLRDL